MKLKISDYWSTPEGVFAEISAKHGPFDLDACATPENAKCEKYYTEQDNALTRPWACKTFMNPPYSNVTPWLEKAVAEMRAGNTTVALLKADHTTAWFKNYIFNYKTMSPHPGVEIVPWPRRIKFDVPPGLVDKDGNPVKSVTPPWGNILVIFHGAR